MVRSSLLSLVQLLMLNTKSLDIPNMLVVGTSDGTLINTLDGNPFSNVKVLLSGSNMNFLLLSGWEYSKYVPSDRFPLISEKVIENEAVYGNSELLIKMMYGS